MDDYQEEGDSEIIDYMARRLTPRMEEYNRPISSFPRVQQRIITENLIRRGRINIDPDIVYVTYRRAVHRLPDHYRRPAPNLEHHMVRRSHVIHEQERQRASRNSPRQRWTSSTPHDMTTNLDLYPARLPIPWFVLERMMAARNQTTRRSEPQPGTSGIRRPMASTSARQNNRPSTQNIIDDSSDDLSSVTSDESDDVAGPSTSRGRTHSRRHAWAGKSPRDFSNLRNTQHLNISDDVRAHLIAMSRVTRSMNRDRRYDDDDIDSDNSSWESASDISLDIVTNPSSVSRPGSRNTDHTDDDEDDEEHGDGGFRRRYPQISESNDTLSSISSDKSQSDNMPSTSSGRRNRIENMPSTSFGRSSRFENLPSTGSDRCRRIENLPSTSSGRRSRIVENMPSTSSCRRNQIENLPSTSSSRSQFDRMPSTSTENRGQIIDLPSTSFHISHFNSMQSSSTGKRGRIENMPSTSYDRKGSYSLKRSRDDETPSTSSGSSVDTLVAGDVPKKQTKRKRDYENDSSDNENSNKELTKRKLVKRTHQVQENRGQKRKDIPRSNSSERSSKRRCSDNRENTTRSSMVLRSAADASDSSTIFPTTSSELGTFTSMSPISAISGSSTSTAFTRYQAPERPVRCDLGKGLVQPKKLVIKNNKKEQQSSTGNGREISNGEDEGSKRKKVRDEEEDETDEEL